MTSAVINSGVEQQVYHFYLFICDVNDVRTLDSRHRVFQCEIKMKLAWHLIKCFTTASWPLADRPVLNLKCHWAVSTGVQTFQPWWLTDDVHENSVTELRVLGSSRRCGWGFKSSGTWRPVVGQVVSDVSKRPFNKRYSITSHMSSILIPQRSFESERRFVCGKIQKHARLQYCCSFYLPNIDTRKSALLGCVDLRTVKLLHSTSLCSPKSMVVYQRW